MNLYILMVFCDDKIRLLNLTVAYILIARSLFKHSNGLKYSFGSLLYKYGITLRLVTLYLISGKKDKNTEQLFSKGLDSVIC